MERDQNRSCWGWMGGGGGRPVYVCFWLNRLVLSCCVSYLIGRGIYYLLLIALQPFGTRPSASGRLYTCAFNKTDRAQTHTSHRPGDSLLTQQSWLSPDSQYSDTLWVSRVWKITGTYTGRKQQRTWCHCTDYLNMNILLSCWQCLKLQRVQIVSLLTMFHAFDRDSSLFGHHMIMQCIQIRWKVGNSTLLRNQRALRLLQRAQSCVR